MRELPNVTVACVDTINYGKAIDAIGQSLTHINPARTILFTDINVSGNFDLVQIPAIKSKDEYSHFIIKKLGEYIKTSHVLVIQADGYVLDGDAWSDEFLQYDYIGAPWLYPDGRNVGNGGFSLRSAKLQKILMEDPYIEYIYPEDEAIGRLYRHYLEKKYDIKFAPEDVASRFSYELTPPVQPTFGFHGKFHAPYRKQVILKREAAMGDILMMEPVMEYFYLQGYQVILDVPTTFYQMFNGHNFPVLHSSQIDAPNARVINLDMAYEVKPKQLALKSYFEMCGVDNPELRNPKLSVSIDATKKLFDKYVVFHIDDTAMDHRNIHGVDKVQWKTVQQELEKLGYTVIQVGKGEHRIGTKMNSSTVSMLMYIIAGADLFVGVDSGPGQIAVACGVKSILFFGSVNPAYRFHDFSKIRIIQNPCPIQKDGCYHNLVSVNGTDCEVDKKLPPCTIHTVYNVLNIINDFL